MSFAVMLSRYAVGARYIEKIWCETRNPRWESGICVMSGGICGGGVESKTCDDA